MTGKTTDKRLVLMVFLGLAGVVFLASPFIGMKTIPWRAVLSAPSQNPESYIFYMIRIPRVFISFLAGAALAVSGMAFQAVFRNALATPFTLGVSSGASLGAALYVRFGLPFTLARISGVSVFAFIGAILSITLVYGLTRARRGFSTATMLLAGVAVNLFFSSIILFIQFTSDFTNSFRIMRWLMGGLEAAGYEPILNMLPFVLAGSVIVLFLTHELNLLVIGEELAISRGVNVNRVKKIIFFATSMMVGGVVAVTGPIGFVGMMAPHICRLIIGPDHRYLAPATLIFGGMFLTVCDTVARTVIAPAEMPVGVITAMLGGPFFIWLLLGDRADTGKSLG